MLLTHFQSMFHFYTSWKHQKTTGSLMFSGFILVEHLLKMDQSYFKEVKSFEETPCYGQFEMQSSQSSHGSAWTFFFFWLSDKKLTPNLRNHSAWGNTNFASIINPSRPNPGRREKITSNFFFTLCGAS